jgi:hypothetical protein
MFWNYILATAVSGIGMSTSMYAMTRRVDGASGRQDAIIGDVTNDNLPTRTAQDVLLKTPAGNLQEFFTNGQMVYHNTDGNFTDEVWKGKNYKVQPHRRLSALLTLWSGYHLNSTPNPIDPNTGKPQILTIEAGPAAGQIFQAILGVPNSGFIRNYVINDHNVIGRYSGSWSPNNPIIMTNKVNVMWDIDLSKNPTGAFLHESNKYYEFEHKDTYNMQNNELLRIPRKEITQNRAILIITYLQNFFHPIVLAPNVNASNIVAFVKGMPSYQDAGGDERFNNFVTEYEQNPAVDQSKGFDHWFLNTVIKERREFGLYHPTDAVFTEDLLTVGHAAYLGQFTPNVPHSELVAFVNEFNLLDENHILTLPQFVRV